jgi:hypothetical protein
MEIRFNVEHEAVRILNVFGQFGTIEFNVVTLKGYSTEYSVLKFQVMTGEDFVQRPPLGGAGRAPFHASSV